MSTPCTTCGQPLHADDERCPTCDALASPADETVLLGGADEPRAQGAPPWSIPIREPGTPAAHEGRPARGRTAGLALLAIGAFLLTVALGTQVLDGGGSDTASDDTARTDPARTDESAGIDGDAVGPETTTSTTTTTAAPTTTEAVALVTTTTTTTAPTTTTTTVAPTTTQAPVPSGTGGVPSLSTSFRGWAAQLTSVPYSAGSSRLETAWETARSSAPGAVAARSDDWSELRDGYWVLVDPGPFGSADEVRAFCASAGLDGDGECLPRELRG